MQTEEARTRLENERKRLEQLRSQVQEELSPGGESEEASMGELSSYDQHPADVGTEVLEKEQDLSLMEQLTAQLEDVDHALHRLELGDYGTCEACGKPIPPERLQEFPAARFCVEDQAAAERHVRGT